MWNFSARLIILTSTVVVLGLLQISSTNASNILCVFPSSAPSHVIVYMSIAKTLAERGHNVTAVTSIKPLINHSAIHNIVIPASPTHEAALTKQFNSVAQHKNNLLWMTGFITGKDSPIIDAQVDVLQDARFKALYETPDTKFDLVMVGYVLNEFLLGVAAKFNCPVIMCWSGVPSSLLNVFVGNPDEISYVPSLSLAVKSGQVMTFADRMRNYFSSRFMDLFSIMLSRKAEKLYNQLFGNEPNFPTLQQMRRNVSLLFVNSHFSEGPIRPNVPAFIEIGGIQIKDKPENLPQDIADLLNNSTENGVVLLSLGSLVKSTFLSPQIIADMFKTLVGLPQNIIWKWDDMENLPGQAKNILYKKWLPQDDILAHPNVKLFITHAGKGGIAEAQYHAVPMVALPAFGDQFANAQKMVSSGFGEQLNLLELTGAAFKQSVSKVLTNPIYAEKLRRFSELYKDRPMTAKENVIYWTEYVIRHQGAKHLQSPLVHMNAVQSSNLDVVGFLLLALYISSRLIKFIVKFIWTRVFRTKNLTKTAEKLKKY